MEKRRGAHHNDEGVSLVEVMIAGMVLLLVMIPMGILLTSISSAAAQTRQRQAAEQLAASWLQVLENTPVPVVSGVPQTNTPILLKSVDGSGALNYNAPQVSDANGLTQLAGTTYSPICAQPARRRAPPIPTSSSSR